MTGFLPSWLAIGGLTLCAARTCLAAGLHGPVPWWLLPCAVALAARTLQ